MQQRNDFLTVIHPTFANLDADLPHVNPPSLKLTALRLKNVFIEEFHAARRRFSPLAVKASLASAIASAIASRLMLL